MRIVRFAVLLVLIGLVSAATAQATGYKATIYFRSGNSVKIDHFGTTTKVGAVTLHGILNGQQVQFSLGDLSQVDFTDPSGPYWPRADSASGTAVITNRQGKRFTVTAAWINEEDIPGAGKLDYVYQDPVTGNLTATSADIRNNVASITMGDGSGDAHTGQMKKNPTTGEFFPATYLYDPYTGAELVWANPPQ